MPRIFKLVSVSIHGIALAIVFFMQAFDVGQLPMPREALAYEDPIAKLAVDVPLPPPSRPATAPEHAVSPDAAPIEAPASVRPETGLERAHTEAVNRGIADGVENGGGAVDFGAIPGATALPAPPPAVEPQRLFHVHEGITPPRKIFDVQPIYPDLARSVRREGVVILETVIDVTGAVKSVSVLRGFDLLNQAAIDSVRQWRFTPALLNGQPVPVVMTVTVNFKLQ